ncbi:hypothetical protein N1031_07985 [Herbiconiux moechotypicola]|uniref:Uncharacterized protein n=1 Tax=Herbiconiux moechotypicola TaxID=637393 RepID=A0ABN3DJH9_9MICO|nr:hypothetical protein [Herbiconiux moechotypicola]MCS5729699.1 hypothetical protein [Herbiconiux moechotypicola]
MTHTDTLDGETPTEGGVARRSVLAAAWAAPVVVATLAAPRASASTVGVNSVQYTSFSSASFQDEQINVNRPLAIVIDGTLAAGDLVTMVVAGTMVRSGGGAGSSRTTPLRISAVNGPNFNVVSTSAGGDGSQTIVLVSNNALPEGTYRKTISWIPLEGSTTEQAQAEILTWPLGTYTADITVDVAGVTGAAQAYTLNRTPVGGAGD